MLLSALKKQFSLGFPFHIPSNGEASGGVRSGKRLVRYSVGAHRPFLIRIPLKLASLVGWPLFLASTVYQGRSIYSERVSVKHARPQNIFYVFWFCLRHQLTVPEYYLYRLDDKEHPYNVDDYLFFYECTWLVASLNSKECNQLIADKLEFQKFLSGHGFAVPKTVVVIKNSQPEDAMLEQELKDLGNQLWVKPRNGYSGIGTEVWSVKKNQYYDSDNLAHTKSQFLDHVHDKANQEQSDQLVQERLINHSSLNVLSNGTLCVLRVVTMSTATGEPVVTLAYLDLPCGDTIQSNQGVIVDVDIKAGRLLNARLHRDMDSSVASHPDTGQVIKDFLLPDWEGSLSLLQQAHQSTEGAKCLGWDLAITDRGPVIIEANASWSADEFQRLMQRPVGKTAFGDVLNGQLE